MVDVLILYPLKTPENQMFSGVFREYKMGSWPEMGSAEWNCTQNRIKENKPWNPQIFI